MEQMQIEEDLAPRAIMPCYQMCQKKYVWALAGIIVCIVFAIGTTISKNYSASVCETLECINAVGHINYFVDRSVNPCDDFHKFACGNFHKRYVSGPTSILASQQADLDRTLFNLVVSDQMQGSLWTMTKNLKLARKFYRTCMNLKTYGKDNDLAFLEAIDYITGGWPSNQTQYKYENWQNVMLKAREIGLHFDFFLDVNITSYPHTYLQVGPPDLKNFDMLRTVEMPNNRKYLQEILDYWGKNDSSLYWEFDETIKFAHKLDEIVMRANIDIKMKRIPPSLTIISNLNKSRHYDMEWLPFLQNLTGIDDLLETENIDYMIVSYPDDNYMSNLNKLIENTPIRHWLNYIIVYNILQEYEYLSEKVQNLCHEMLDLFPTDTHRMTFCLLETGTYFRKDAEKFIVNHIISPDQRTHIQAIYNDIVKSFQWHLEQAFASNDTIREESIARLKNVTFHIGASDHFFDDKMFEEAFGSKPLQLSDNMVKMLHELERNRIDNFFRMVRKPGLHNRFLEIEANAFFYTLGNSLYLLAPLLVEPIYSLNRPAYLNYGALGSIIAHELMHMYDFGIRLKYNNNSLANWEFDMIKHREISQTCAQEQYTNYYRNLFNSSANVLVKDMDEVLADFAAVNIAYVAYSNYTNSTDKKLPGLRYTPYQLFWIMTSTIFCDDPRLERSEANWANPKHPKTRNYPLASYRVNGPKMNSPHFAKYFGCAPGSHLNPVEKCTSFP